MMQQWNCHGNMAKPVVCPTQYRCHDQFIPREVPFIHPIVNVNRQHIVEVPRHFYTETTRNVMGETLPARPGFGPQMGGYGPQVGGIGSQMGGYGPQVGGIGSQMGGYGPNYGRPGNRPCR